MTGRSAGHRPRSSERTPTEIVIEERRFASGGEQCAATLYLPGGGDGPVPCVVLAQGFSLTRRDGVPRYAERFAQAGVAALTFDYRHLGDSSGEPRQLVDHRLQRQDVAAAVGFARSLAVVDPDRVVLWGYSLGGGHVLHHVARDDRIAAAILHFPMVDGRAFLGMLGLRHALRIGRVMAAALFRGRSIHLAVTGPPGSLAMLTQPEAEPGFRSVCAAGSVWRNEFRARPTRPISTYRPVREARKVRCPLLVCLGERDTIVAGSSIQKVVRRAPRGVLRTYDQGHFDPFLDGFEAVVVDQLAELQEVVTRPVGPRG